MANTALRAIQGILKFVNLTADFLLESDAGFNNGVASLYAHDPILATYLLGCRADWLKQWADTHQGAVSDDPAPPSPAAMRVTLGRVSALVENICVHLLSNSLAKRTKSIVVVEIPYGKRSPEYMRRFDVVLAAEVTRWTLEYKPTGFSDQ